MVLDVAALMQEWFASKLAMTSGDSSRDVCTEHYICMAMQLLAPIQCSGEAVKRCGVLGP